MRWNRLWLTRWLTENDNPIFYWLTFCLRTKEGLFNPPSVIPAQAGIQWFVSSIPAQAGMTTCFI